MPIDGEQYIRAKVRQLNGLIKTNFLSEYVKKENELCICIACITIDSV